MSHNKYSLLSKKTQLQETDKTIEIQMNSFNYPDTSSFRKKKQQPCYMKLDQKDFQEQKLNSNKNQQNINRIQDKTAKYNVQSTIQPILDSKAQKAYQKPKQNKAYQNQVSQSQAPYKRVPPSQYNPSQSQYRQSQIQSPHPSQIKPNIPDMTVNCDKCTFTQQVPANAQLYICCMCNQINQSFPLCGVFTCGVCYTNVVYPYCTSIYIKCTKCSTVNKVPFQPVKKYKQPKSSQLQPKSSQLQTKSNINKPNKQESNYEQDQQQLVYEVIQKSKKTYQQQIKNNKQTQNQYDKSESLQNQQYYHKKQQLLKTLQAQVLNKLKQIQIKQQLDGKPFKVYKKEDIQKESLLNLLDQRQQSITQNQFQNQFLNIHQHQNIQTKQLLKDLQSKQLLKDLQSKQLLKIKTKDQFQQFQLDQVVDQKLPINQNNNNHSQANKYPSFFD